MMNKLLLALLLLLCGVNTANAEGVCLDYWLKGPAACKSEKDKKKIIINGLYNKKDLTKVKKDKVRVKYEKDLNVKIDKFLAGYGKPPREFVAFHLDPTLENAVRWVKKFNTDYERTMKVAVAWRQADQLFKEYRDTGKLNLPADSGVSEKQIQYLLKALEEKSTDLPEVKGFGVNLPGDWDEDRLGRNYASLRFKDQDKERAEYISKLSNTGGSSKFSLAALDAKTNKQRTSNNGKTQVKPGKSTGGLPIEVSYYFSAKCPFCVKYQQSLKEVINKVGKKNVKLTCVDMTPGEGNRVKSNKGDLSCKWRPIMDNEARQFGIKKTPSILVKRKGAKSLELLENYHDSDTLERYFRYGTRKDNY